MPFEVTRFDYNDRRYMLFNLSCHWLVAKRICELLGGSLACLDNKETTEYVMKKLESYKIHRIILGGYRKRDEWFWLNGKKANTPQNEHTIRSIPVANLNCIALYNGNLFNCQTGSMFLCEWRLNSASSTLR